MIDLQAYLTRQRQLVNTELNRLLEALVPPGRLHEAMQHSLAAGGKRLRPILTLAAAEAVEAATENLRSILIAGCALEIIHTYSLIHDDLPAIDNDDLRRGQPSCHAAFDEATAIFAGDAMHTLAFQILSEKEHLDSDPRKQLRIINIIARATGNHGMIEGQMRDMIAQGAEITLPRLQEMHQLKTGALIIAAVKCGAVLGTDDERSIARLETYAENIGLAFQIVDDILDIKGDASLLGKKTGADQQQRKATYPGTLGLEQSRELARSLIEKSLQALEPFHQKADPLRAIANYIIERQY